MMLGKSESWVLLFLIIIIADLFYLLVSFPQYFGISLSETLFLALAGTHNAFIIAFIIVLAILQIKK